MDVFDRAKTEWLQFAASENLKNINVEFKLNTFTGSGFCIKPTANSYKISASCGQELIHGAFELMRLYRLGQMPKTDYRSEARFDLRMLWSWSRIGGTYRHSPYMKFLSVLRHENMADPENSPELMRFLRHMASMGVNAITLNHDLHHGELIDFDQHAFRPYYKVLESFALYLEQWGIDLYLYTTSTPEKKFRRDVVDTDCPFNPQVRSFTEDFIDEIATQVPHVKGMLMAGGLGGYANGHLYDCTCEHCKGKTALERAFEQVNILTNALSKHDMKLFYTVTTDIPFTLDREVDSILAYAEQLPQNVFLTFKNCFHDFEELRYPEHPLFSRLKERNINCGQIAVEYQLFPEMRGKGLIMSNVSEQWEEYFNKMESLGIGSVIGVTETHPDDAHPSMADWYSFGRLCYDRSVSGRTLQCEWAQLEYPKAAAECLTDILHDSYFAASNTIYAGGVQCGIHGMIVPHPHYMKHKMNDTWCRTNQPLPFGVLGVEDEPFHLYTKEMEATIRSNPRLTLLNRAQVVDDRLKAVLLKEKEDAVKLFTSMRDRWLNVKTVFSPDDYRYTQMLQMLSRNVEDAKRFKRYLQVFLDYQSGSLTEQSLEEARKSLVGTGADCSINTCDELMSLFLKHIGHLLRKESYDTKFNNMTDLPQLEGKVWQEGKYTG